jgi:hypothetical protein
MSLKEIGIIREFDYLGLVWVFNPQNRTNQIYHQDNLRIVGNLTRLILLQGSWRLRWWVWYISHYSKLKWLGGGVQLSVVMLFINLLYAVMR